jgi:hypothetical protein
LSDSSSATDFGGVSSHGVAAKITRTRDVAPFAVCSIR